MTPSLTSIQPLQTLIVEDFGAHVGKHSERLRVTVKGELKVEAPLLYLRQVIVKARGVSISSDAILACAERGIALHFVSGVSAQSGASLYTAGLTGTVLTRRAQLLAYTDGRALSIAGAIASAKINNQASLLLYHARSRKTSAPKLAAELRLLAHEVLDHDAELDDLLARARTAKPSDTNNTPDAHDTTNTTDSNDTGDARPAPRPAVVYPIDRYRNALLSIEGRAAQKYWAGVKLLLPAELGWEGRRTRHARDPFNSALNYGYAILSRQIEQALVLAGLDPFAGFLHADRPGKPSLTFDLIEEFRQAVVDRTVIGMVGKNMPLTLREDGLLDDDSRRSIAEKVIERIEQSAERYEGKRRTLREIIQTQARHMATFLRGDRANYTGFVAR
ncbi:MAG: CRISPR-associated endonuclease Cas1 [Candidatus Roseilinea sp.]|nr:MAG: CRISPR-associated endonuclease Cas1 [Candidatus Roseilinea sp.]